MNKMAFKKALITQLLIPLMKMTELKQMKQQIVNITEALQHAIQKTEALQYAIQKTVPLAHLSKWSKLEFRPEVKEVIQKVNRAQRR